MCSAGTWTSNCSTAPPVTAQATVTAVLYVGNTEDTYGWGGRTDGLEASGVVQGQVAITRWW